MNKLTLDFLTRMADRNKITFRVEGTGGGCEALVATLEGGFVLALSSSNLDVDFGAYVDDEVGAGLYSPDAWENGCDPVRDGSTMIMSVDGLVDLVDSTLHGPRN